MIKVRLIKSWDWPNILRQTPRSSGIWQDIKFTFEPIANPDYVVVFNYSPEKIQLYCTKGNIWSLQHEPPNDYFRFWHRAHKIYSRVFTTDPTLTGDRYIHGPPALPWHVGKTYDNLLDCPVPKKTRKLSFITTNKKSFAGHKDRIKFLEKIRKELNFDLFGYGFNPIKDKWDGLVPYKYSLAVENFCGPYYWSEKLSDCFLAWTMPIYYGCTNINDYFPKDSLIRIDINNPHVIDQIKEIIESDLWIKKRKAIEKARNLVLNHYQFFPYFSKQIYQWENRHKEKKKKELVTIPAEHTRFQVFAHKIKRFLYLVKSGITKTL